MLLLKQMVILFILMLVGLICRKTGILTSKGSKVVSGIVVNVANPALVLSASINKESVIQGRNLLITVGLALGIYVFLILVAFILPVVLRISDADAGTYRVITVFSNIGFMGFPLISAVYGSEALLYASVFLLPYNVLIYTWGISALTKGKKQTSEPEERKVQWGKIINVGVISCVVTMVIYLTRIPIPQPIESAVSSLANLTAPLSMMVIGASMADMKFKEMLTDARLLAFTVVKLILVPLVGVSLIKLFGFDSRLLGVCLVMLSTPVGSMTAMLAQQYDGDYDLASKGVALTTVLSVITMPLMSAILHV